MSQMESQQIFIGFRKSASDLGFVSADHSNADCIGMEKADYCVMDHVEVRPDVSTVYYESRAQRPVINIQINIYCDF